MNHKELEEECLVLTRKLRSLYPDVMGQCPDKFITQRFPSLSLSVILIQSGEGPHKEHSALGEGTPEECYNNACRYIVARM